MGAERGRGQGLQTFSFDVLGAKSFGFKVCWINRAGTPLDPLGPIPDVVVKSFEELEAAIG